MHLLDQNVILEIIHLKFILQIILRQTHIIFKPHQRQKIKKVAMDGYPARYAMVVGNVLLVVDRGQPVVTETLFNV